MVEAEALERRVSALEHQMSDVRVVLAELGAGLKANTALTERIALDTAETVSLMKGMKVLGKLAGIGTALAGFAAVVATYITSVKH